MRSSRFLKFIIPFGVFLAGFDFFSYRLSTPSYEYFDEPIYVESARQIFSKGVNLNWSHPPTAKVLIGLGIRLLGDHPNGWRFPGVLFGCLTLVAVYLWGRILFGNFKDALKVSWLTLFNQLLFTQARVATLDIFMIGFLSVGIALVLPVFLSWNKINKYRNFSFSGIFFGAASSAKWFAVFPVFAVSVFCFIAGRAERAREWTRTLLPFLGGVLITYFAIFLLVLSGMFHPFYSPDVFKAGKLSYGPKEILKVQKRMLEAQIEFKNTSQLYQSRWPRWPLIMRPMRIESKTASTDSLITTRIIMFLGNPLVMWSGVLAILVCAFQGVRVAFFKKNDLGIHLGKESAIIVSAYAFFLLIWAVIPRATTFYYYYAPAALWLGPAIVLASRILHVPKWLEAIYYLTVLAVFIYFLPVLSFSELTEAELSRRLLFETWR